MGDWRYLGHVFVATRIPLREHSIHEQPPIVQDVFFVHIDASVEIFLDQLLRIGSNVAMVLLKLSSDPSHRKYPATYHSQVF